MKIGFFGGCFNPPTNAHIALAKEAIIQSKLDKVIFVPMGDKYPKVGLANASHRYNMLKIACSYSKLKNIEVSDIELKANKNMKTIEAFKLIEKAYPKDEKYFIIGADNFINLIKWKESEELVNNYKYIVLEREQINLQKYIHDNDILKKNISKIQIIKNQNHKYASSTKYRNGLEKNLILPKVQEYIEENNLY